MIMGVQLKVNCGKTNLHGNVDARLLPRRQRQVLRALKAGHQEKHIAGLLDISPHTVHSHVKAVYRYYSVNSRAELLARWIRK
jgi:DNA-binding NarL/FixJ family response regulator